ncbi:indolepyruvate ferredoxin oxidoreductase family protein [Blastococcus xanthinilyticus]|uniref:Indolepyruvate ferredoxin oxidoreductase n=1 Tax=Blastococcus xanthinilyticus TaxID=1564164 RepID=A0A5S5D0T8_9ACTN|nr:indolepyruvate ferredoxin oxidoreductase family protein [Blastococcus xanthinilyticus]TYP88868.1 indolepyruvate ferredoxin oxidoreductase [Blastococcus xanthinilyticus]
MSTAAQVEDRYRQAAGLLHVTGIQALVRVALDQVRADRRRGRRPAGFISGYPGSPLGGLDLELGRRGTLLEEHDIVFRPGVNEELAATAVAGSQLAQTRPERRYDGVTGIWYGKAPGVDRAVDALRHGNMAGAAPDGGVLALVGDDPSAKSSTMPNASEATLAAVGMPVLYPADAQDALDLGLHGIALSRASGLWVGVKVVTDVADGSGTVEVHPDRIVPVRPDTTIDGRAFRHEVRGMLLQPTSGELEATLYHQRPLIAQRYAAANGLDRIERSGPDDRIGIVAAGKTYLDVCQALAALGLDEAECRRRGVRLLKLGMVAPVEPGIVRSFAEGLREIVVVEEKRSFIETAVVRVLYGRPGAPAVHGKTGPDGRTLVPVSGELEPDLLAGVLARRLLALGGLPSVEAWSIARGERAAREERRPALLPLLSRTPYYCSGCPHSTSMAAPEGTLIGTGTGCSSLAVLMDPETVGDVSVLMQMGGEGSQWIGMAPFVDVPHMVQNIGDGTFHHSGSLAVRAAVAAGVDITYKLLYNSAVAMTGGQSAQGGMTVPALAAMLTAEGVARIIVTTDQPERYRRVRLPGTTTVWHRDRLVEAQEELARVPGVTVLVHDQECATEKRRRRKRGLLPEPATRVLINERVCEGCGDCGQKSNCLSVVPVDTEFGRKTQIHQASCNKDYTCLAGDCPSFLSVVPGVTARRPVAAGLDPATLPEPAARVAVEDFSLRIVGIGGTGVVTVAQVLATAAQLGGLHVRGMDQTGMAQKGGAVVSDLKFTRGPVVQAARVAGEECDLLLGCDILVAAEPKNLAVTDPARTVAVVSTAQVATGAMVTHPDVSFPSQPDLQDRIRAATRGAAAVFLDAHRLTQQLFGSDQSANVLLLGAAYQAGALPVPAAAIEEAIAVNGAAVETNVQAFRRGRQAVADPDRLAADVAELSPAAPGPRPLAPEVAAVVGEVQAPAGSELARVVAARVPDLVGYQDLAWARRYADLVERVRVAEDRVVPGSGELAEAVALGLYKLMSYKDEYEVARLCIDPAVEADVTARFGRGARYSYRLHPPLLRYLGRRDKVAVDARAARPVLRTLYGLRRLRGTVLDPFGHTEVRRTERALIEEYQELVHRLAEELTPANHRVAVELAGLPDMVRGYEEIKMGNVARYHEHQGEALRRFTAPVTPLETTTRG